TPTNTATSTATDTPTTTRTSTATGTATATATATCVGGGIGPWVTRSPLPVDVYGAAVDGDGTNVYAASGYSFSGGGWIGQFARSKRAGNSWTSLAAMPNPAEQASGVYAPNTGRFYVFGGSNASTPTNLTRIYDPGANTWSAGTVMPAARAGTGGGYYNGK